MTRARILWLAGLLLFFQPTCRQSEFVKTPYLQKPGQSEITIRWSTRLHHECTLSYGSANTPDTVLRVSPFHSEGELNPEYLYRATLTKLNPGTTYRYTVKARSETHGGTFQTAPDKPTAFPFIVYGDSRTQAKEHRRVAACFTKHRPAFLINTGDLVTSGTFDQYQTEFFEPLADAIRNTPIWVVRGNHDGGPAFGQLFDLPTVKDSYSFDWGNAHFLCLGMQIDEKMLAWVEQDLAASKARWKFVFHHLPIFDDGSHREAWGRNSLLPILRKHRVDFALSGHSHGYQRFWPMFKTGENDDHPITFIVTAGGGAPLYRVESSPHLAVGRSVYHYVLFEIDGDHLMLRALTPEGHEIDALRLTKEGTKPDATYLARALPEESFGELRALVAPYFQGGFTFTKRPTPESPGTITFPVGAGDRAMRFEITLEERAREFYDMDVVRGKVGPNETVDVTVSIRPKRDTVQPGVLSPTLRLRCEYEINGQRGHLYSGRLKFAPPAPGQKTRAKDE